MTFPVTRAEVMALREQEGFVTPIEPVTPGKPWCVFESRGTIEFMCHPSDAAYFLEHGIVVDDKRLDDVKVVGEWPMIGAIQIVACDLEQNQTFTPSVRATENPAKLR